ncbi:MAG: nucleoside/nucleotide kinase family protein [Clostridium sp.]|jgi:pantothenate kinase|uniref:nucleoside/nucleotide kinase family protein n=1 Tax=Clostridium sp. TaxID=1506 RepID=UPI0025BBC1AB|nr:nucleoside/nucleotide kinase family protein [Clostridium sp.]MCH3964259.1 nucleoside/nucleotide kinase family protein [Clostridium sp.]MCI1715439.1 nucleoside/nucleotide kinase family protein [Clostridium sp.]MCI1799770.1 nucleoside/nucleotide kinase family protein [Clostridium sp.]MCI1813622.1 nucleoside/nucleotide kinase family protein [Clostridium sp.]MCI1870587.1 nucleoside/nucleotide kinase family protein [Clostridium sp.]
MLDRIVSYKFSVNSFEVNADYYERDIKNIFIPILKKLTHMKKNKNGRFLVYLAAPPGAGKSTLASFLEFLSRDNEEVLEIQAVGIDGFHYHQDYIKNNSIVVDGKKVPMVEVKGCPETFDLDRLKSKIAALKHENVMWPVYDRNLHDVVEDQILVTKDIVLIEGNWLLLDEDKWRELKEYCDYSIFIDADEAMLKERLVQRKTRGGLSREDAVKFYEKSDGKNLRRVMDNSSGADLYLKLSKDGKYETGGIINGN